MKRSLILGLAIVTLSANAAFAADGTNRTIDRLHTDMAKAEARLASNASEQTVDQPQRSMSRFDLGTT